MVLCCCCLLHVIVVAGCLVAAAAAAVIFPNKWLIYGPFPSVNGSSKLVVVAVVAVVS